MAVSKSKKSQARKSSATPKKTTAKKRTAVKGATSKKPAKASASTKKTSSTSPKKSVPPRDAPSEPQAAPVAQTTRRAVQKEVIPVATKPSAQTCPLVLDGIIMEEDFSPRDCFSCDEFDCRFCVGEQGSGPLGSLWLADEEEGDEEGDDWGLFDSGRDYDEGDDWGDDDL